MIDFLTNESDFKELNLRNPELLIEFRNQLLDLQTKNSDINIVEFFSYFIDKTGILTYIETH